MNEDKNQSSTDTGNTYNNWRNNPPPSHPWNFQAQERREQDRLYRQFGNSAAYRPEGK